jgi:hypothetical protein
MCLARTVVPLQKAHRVRAFKESNWMELDVAHLQGTLNTTGSFFAQVFLGLPDQQLSLMVDTGNGFCQELFTHQELQEVQIW